MNNKLNNMLNDFLAKNEAKTDEELNKKLEEFMFKYNAGLIDYVNTPLDDAYDLLEQAERAKSKKKAIQLAQKAYEKSRDCFDAILFQVDLEDEYFKKLELLDAGLKVEEEHLKKEGYFDKDNIGCFYDIYETRPYIRGLCLKAQLFLECGKIKLARDICLEILKLNNNDNTGIRYLLMAIYAYLEDEKELLKLCKGYQEENLEVLFPQFALYYKLGKEKEAKEMLDRINKENPHFLKLFKGSIKANPKVLDGYHSIGDSSEVFMYFMNYSFLILTMPNIQEYVLKNSKKTK